MRTRAILTGILLVLAATPAFAQKEPLKEGDKAPKLEAETWFNLPKGMKTLEPADLKGQIVIAVFWAEYGQGSQRTVPFLSDLQAKYRAKGVVLVGLCNDGESKVEPFITKHKVSYIVGAGARLSWQAFGVRETPTGFLIDSEGKIVWTGNPAAIDEPLTKLLLEKPAKKASFLLESSAADSFKKASKLLRDRKYVEAMDELEFLTKEFKGTKDAEKAQAEIKKMKSNSKVMDIIRNAKASKIANGWLEVARMCVQYGDKDDAVKYYDRIVKKYPETDAGRYARAEVAPLKKKSKVADDDEEDDKKSSKSKDEPSKVKAKKDKDKGEAKEDEEEEEGSGKGKSEESGEEEEED